MGYTPHNPFGPPKDQAFPVPDPHQDEAAAFGRAQRSLASAVVAAVLAVASLVTFWWGSALLLIHLVVAVVIVVFSAVVWRASLRQHRPAGVAIAAFGMSLLATGIVLLLYL